MVFPYLTMRTVTAFFKVLRVGGATSYAEIGTDGTLRLYGNATAWRDEPWPLIGAKLESPSSDIVQNTAEASLTFKKTAALADYVLAVPQLNHDWKVGSVIYPHLHWWQASANVPNWLIQYRWQRQGQVKVTNWTNIRYTAHVFTYSTGTLNQITQFGSITPPTGAGLSDIVQMRVLRDAANASALFSGSDPLNASADAVSFDPHIEIDRLGSDTEYANE